MESQAAALAFATLGHPGRLAVLRLLMRFAPRGVRPTEIAAALGLKPNTLSHHLADLTGAGLVTVSRQGRSLFYAADLEVTEGLVGYLALDLGRARPDLLSPLLERPAPGSPLAVLFLCSANSARSILAEALLRDLGQGRYSAFSAGTSPAGQPHPLALETLRAHGHATEGLVSKPLSALRRPAFDLVITVCDTAAAEDCPAWPGQPVAGHWGLPDPVPAGGEAFTRTYKALRRRVEALVALPVQALNRRALQARVDDISLLEQD
ncbi:MAG: metalloregulator ArsR/SmtB family transcription factor [Pararhodobacter sp.]